MTYKKQFLILATLRAFVSLLMLVIIAYLYAHFSSVVGSNHVTDRISHDVFSRNALILEFITDRQVSTGEDIILLNERMGSDIQQYAAMIPGQSSVAELMESHERVSESVIELLDSLGELSMGEYGALRGSEAILINTILNESRFSYRIIGQINQEASNSLSELFSDLRMSLIIIICISIIIVLFSSSVSFRMIQKMAHVRSIATEFAARNFDHRIAVKSKDEIGDMAASFNVMADRMQGLYVNLEKKIKERTRQIEKVNSNMEAIVESMGEGVVVLDNQRRVVQINAMASQLCKVDMEEVLGKVWPEYVLPKNEQYRLDIEKYPEVGCMQKGMCQIASTKDKIMYQGNRRDPFIVHLSVAPYEVGEERMGTVLVFRDITEEAAIDKAKTDFVAVASHQLKTPLSAINWYSEILRGELDKEEDKTRLEYVRTIEQSSRRMVSLVNNLLNASRIESGRIRVVPDDLRLHEVIDDVIAKIKSDYPAKGIRFKRDYGPETEVLHNDAEVVRMIAVNLIGNAVQYSPDRSLVTVSLKKQDDGMVMMSVRDRGCGIPESEQGMIFKKMFRATNAIRKDTDGNGLGLYVVKRALDESGGQINFTSKEGSGSEFQVIFPAEANKNDDGVKLIA
jgi:PAS domain S-box-containing protein